MRLLSRIRAKADIIGDAVGLAAICVTLIMGIWILHGLGLSGLDAMLP